MSRTIESPGVEFREIDFSLYQQVPVGTNIVAFGYANQGPTEEMLNVSTISEYEQVFGAPTNAAERYLYHTANQVLKSPANLLVTRLPYGSGDGVGYGNTYSALVYPTAAASEGTDVTVGYNVTSFLPSSAFDAVLSTSTTLSSLYDPLDTSVDSLSSIHPFANDLNVGEVVSPTMYALLTAAIANSEIDAEAATVADYLEAIVSGDPSGFYFGAPKHLTLSEAEYETIKCGGFNWASVDSLVADPEEFCPFDAGKIGGAGMIIVNESRTTIDDIYEGYYLTVTDNKNANPTTAFDDVTGVKVSTGLGCSAWSDVPSGRLGFNLSADFDGTPGSTSEIIENVPGVDFGESTYQDSVIVSLWKLRTSNQTGTSDTLDDVLVESHVGSFNSFRKEGDPFGTVKKTFFIENVINNNSRHMRAFVNPNISELNNWVADDGTPARVVRGFREGTTTDAPAGAIANWEYSDNLFSIGEWVPKVGEVGCPKDIGNLPAKLERAINNVANPELIDIDLTLEAGLGTVWTTVKADRGSWCTGDQRDQSFTFTDTVALDTDTDLSWQAVGSGGNYVPAGGIQDHYETIFHLFNTFAEHTMKRNGGVGHLHISDPLRHILVNGRDCKVLGKSATDKSFSRNVYWPLRNLYQSANTSYSCTYGNWAKTNDSSSDKYCWMPMSGWAGAVMARTDFERFPWIAPAGLNRAVLPDIVDLAINPNQKERDLLYRIGVNPVVLFPDQGYTIFGQKTLLRRPSAFDRINVRRLFLALEKVTQRTLRNFVFEPNTIFTRTRVKNTIAPIFDQAKNNEGVYDYMIICDERNNQPDQIDRNELQVDIYLKPVKAGEFISVNFVATRTGQDFRELV